MLTQQQLQFLNLRASSPSAYNRHCCHPRALCLCSLFPWTHFYNQPEATTSPKLPRSFFPWLRLRLLVVFFSENDSYGHFFSAFSSSWIFFYLFVGWIWGCCLRLIHQKVGIAEVERRLIWKKAKWIASCIWLGGGRLLMTKTMEISRCLICVNGSKDRLQVYSTCLTETWDWEDSVAVAASMASKASSSFLITGIHSILFFSLSQFPIFWFTSLN